MRALFGFLPNGARSVKILEKLILEGQGE